ncbi:MAG: hypothetical protein GXN99_01330 [Candidatus Nanohaloarchaeota archaeon]|nr:hypothetical protein [Candidatus Nanohaloarchaeota archaeon]
MLHILESWALIVQQYKNYIKGKESISHLLHPLKSFEKQIEKNKNIINALAKVIYDEILEQINSSPFKIEKSSYRVKEKYHIKMLRAIFEFPYSNHLNDVIGIKIITSNEIESVELAYTLLDKFRSTPHYILSPKNNTLFYDWIENKEITSPYIPLKIDKKYITTGFTSIKLNDDLWKFMKNYYSRVVDELTMNHHHTYKAIHIDKLQEIGIMKLPIQIIITDKSNAQIQNKELSHEWYVSKRLEHLKNNIKKQYSNQEEKERAYEIFNTLSC